MDGNAHILVGKIVKAHALRGGVKVIAYAESPDVFRKNGQLIAVDPSGRERVYTIAEVKAGGRTLLVTFLGIDSREAAEAMTGCELFVAKSILPPADDESYYWFEIIGLNVRSVSGEYIGRVVSILPTGGNDVYIVEHEGTETLIPAVEDVVLSIDLEQKSMVVDLPEGLSS